MVAKNFKFGGERERELRELWHGPFFPSQPFYSIPLALRSAVREEHLQMRLFPQYSHYWHECSLFGLIEGRFRLGSLSETLVVKTTFDIENK